MFFNTSSTQHILRSHLICITSTTPVLSPQASQVEKRIIKRGQPGVSYRKSALKNNTTHISYFWIISWTFPCLHLWTTYHHLTTSVGWCQSECHRYGAEICYTIYSIQQLFMFPWGPKCVWLIMKDQLIDPNWMPPMMMVWSCFLPWQRAYHPNWVKLQRNMELENVYLLFMLVVD